MQANLTAKYLSSQGQDYRIYPESDFTAAIQTHIQMIAKQRADGELPPNAQLTLYVISSKVQRQEEIVALLPKIEPNLCIRLLCERFPFDFHSYRFRGKTCVGVVVDNLIADTFFAGFPKPFDTSPEVVTNHQATLNLSLSTVCYNARSKEYKDFYFIV